MLIPVSAGVVVFNLEFYFDEGIQSDHPGRTPLGRPSDAISLGQTHIPPGDESPPFRVII
jgi:hypothetical protein